ncbi:autotransporter-associated beta strand repeat-containing protein [Ancylobacter sp. IITR112]|uniref:autotransporter-associated beta strand repeat-containing protein n=1 Tax=Ancylobacter sp. IITR112 TaxID=3138073 RepID=UPI00352A62B8
MASLRAALLASVALLAASPTLAQSVNGATNPTGPGGNGLPYAEVPPGGGGGGGGGGVTGGFGAAGNSPEFVTINGDGGVGGFIPGLQGTDGGDGDLGGSGGGGGGGAHGYVGTEAPSGTAIGGQGGDGGDGGEFNTDFEGIAGGGGGPGAGGYGAVIELQGGSLVLLSPVLGGDGGDGGSGASFTWDGGDFPVILEGGAGNGGDGGTGLYLYGSGGSVGIQNEAKGGDGGMGGHGVLSSFGGIGGNGLEIASSAASVIIEANAQITGGDGGISLSGGTSGPGGYGILISGDNNVVTLFGTAAGGIQGGNPAGQSAAIAITGDGNTLVLTNSYVATGGVAVSGGSNALALGGNAGDEGVFDAGSLGSSFYGFTEYAVLGGTTWTLFGESSFAAAWNVEYGTLSIDDALSLGPDGDLLISNSGQLTTTATMLIGQPIELSGGDGPGATFNVESGTVLNLSGQIQGDGNLIVTGGGMLVLSGDNDISGTTTVAQGTLSLLGASPLGAAAGTLILADGATLEFATNGSPSGPVVTGAVTLAGSVTFLSDYGTTGTISGNISDGASSGGFTLSGQGSLLLTGTNSFTGPVTVSAGTLILGSAAALPASAAVTVDESATLQVTSSVAAASLAGAGAVNLGTNTLTVGGGNGSSTFSGNFIGTGGLIKTGAGTFTLAGATGTLGSLTVTGGAGGSLILNAPSVLASSAEVSVTSNSMLQLGASLTIGSLSGDGALDLGSSTLTVDAASDSAFAGILSGSGSLVKSGAGTLTLSGTNASSGPILIQAGALVLAGGAAIGDLTAVTVASGAQLTLNTSETIGSFSGSGAIALGGNTLTFGGDGLATTFSGTISGGSLVDQNVGSTLLTGTYDLTSLTIGGGTLQIGDGVTATSFAGTIVNNGTLVLDPAQSIVMADAISGNGSVSINGQNGVVTFTGAKTYTGDTSIMSGTLNLGSGTSVGSVAGNIVNDGALVFNSSASQTYAGVIMGTGSVSAAGGGLVTLSGTNLYAGGTSVSNGSTISVSSDANLGATSGGVALSNGTLSATASFASARTVTLTGSGTVNVDSGQTLTLSGSLGESGSSQLIKEGLGTLVLTGSNSYSGGTAIYDGMVQVAADANLGAALGGLTLDNGTLATSASFTTERAVTLGGGGGTFSVAAGTVLTLAGTISGAGAVATTGGGELALTGVATYTGGTTVGAATLGLYGGSLATSAVTIADGGTLQGFGSIAGVVTVQSGGTLAGGAVGQPNTQNTALMTGQLSLDSGSGVSLVLGGAGNAGVAEVSGDLALDGTLSVSGEAVHGAGIYRVFTYTGTASGNFASLDLSGLADSASYTGTIETGDSGRVNLLLRDDSAVQVWTTDDGTSFGGSGIWSSTSTTWDLLSSGQTIPWGGETGIFTGTAGTVTVSGAQNFKKLEFVTDGYVLQADGGDATSALNVTDGGVLWVEGHDVTATIGAPITGTGGIEKVGTGTLILTGANTYTGGTKVSGGFLSVASAASLGAAGNVLTLADGGLEATGSFTLASAVVLDGFGTLKPAAGQTLTVSGVISGTGNLRKDGAGTLVLSAANTYVGSTVIVAGTLEAQGGSALPDASAVRIEAAGTLQLDANEGIGSLSGSGAVNLQSNTLSVGYDDTDTVFAGSISGTGGLTKVGAGTLTLTGASTYSGTTTISQGALIIGDGGTNGSIAGNVTTNGTLSFDRSDEILFLGTISGSGGVQQLGSGTLILTGTNTYAGGTLVAEGTLQVNADANLGNSSGAIVIEDGTLQIGTSFTSARVVLLTNGGRIEPVAGTTLTLTGSMVGTGGLTKQGGGTLILAADNAFAGTTTIKAGVLQLGNGGTTGSVVGNIVNDGTLTLNRSTAFTFSNIVTGSGTVIQAGIGAMVVTGGLYASGGLQINQGTTVQMGNGTSWGEITGPIVNNGTLIYNEPGTQAVFSVISGTGQVVQSGPGDLSLAAANTYSGGTFIINGSKLRVLADSALGAPTGGITLATGILSVDVGFASVRNVTLVGGGTINVEGGETFTLSGSITGTGDLTLTGGGTLVLTGNSAYSGNTVVAAGTLQVGDGGTSGSISGNVVNAGTLVFQRSDNILYAGTVSGSGTLEQAGSGTLVLTGTNTYTGGTRISGGTLMLGNGTATGSIAGDVINDGDLSFNRTEALTFGGVISGSGQVSQFGSGTITLTGVNTYAGGTLIGAGATLQVASDGNLGAAAGTLTLANGILAPTTSFTSARTVTLTGTGGFSVGSGITLALTGKVGGDGGLVVAGGGTLELGGINSYAGGTLVSGATLAVHADESLGASGTGLSLDGAALKVLHSFSTARDITLSAAGAVIEVAEDRFLAVSGTVTGTGVLTKTGDGRLTLTGANAFGGLIIHAGTVVGTAGSIQGDVLDNGALVFDQPAAGTFAGDIGGTGSLSVKGEGTLILTGNAFHTGGTTIDGGTLQIGDGGTSGWLSGAIFNNGTLIYDLAARYTFPTALSGPGQVILEGGGTVDFAGSTYAGLVQVNDARVLVRHGTVSDANFSVAAGGVLGGSGTVGIVDILDGGTISPGFSPGTLNVTGKMALAAGSTYRADVTAGSGHDLIAVTGAVGINATSTLDVHAQRGTYADYKSFTILTASDGVHGVFGTVTTNFAFLDALVDYTDNEVILNLVRRDIPFWREAHSWNQLATANAVESLGAGNEIYDAVASQLKSEAFIAFDALSGEIYATTGAVIQQQSVFTRDAVGARLRQAAFEGGGAPLAYASDGPQTAGLGSDSAATMWIQGFGARGDIGSNGNAASASDTIGGFVGGVDAALAETARLGVYGSYSSSWFNVSGRDSSGSMDNYELGLYGALQQGPLALRLGAGYAWHDMSLARTVAFPGYSASNNGDVTTGSAQLFGEIGYDLPVGSADLEPFLGLAYLHLDGWNLVERGSNSALRVDTDTMDTFYTTLGLRGGQAIDVNGVPITASFTLGWQHAFGDTVPAAVMSFVTGSAPFYIEGAPIAPDTFVFGGGLAYELNPNTRLGLRYDGQIASSAQQNAISGGLQIRF